MLRNRTDHETDKLKGVMLAADPIKLELGRFTHLANWIPADVTSLRKKRGVVALSTDAISPTVINPEDCA